MAVKGEWMALADKTALFRRTRLLENQIDEFLQGPSEAGLVFQMAIKEYLQNGAGEGFDASLRQVSKIENRGDELRRTIETQLYEQTLIPELRADVLNLLEDVDVLTNDFQGNCYRFSIEKPEIPAAYHKDFLLLTETVVTCVECLVMAVRAFFRNVDAVRDQSHKVIFYETEADKISTKLKRAIFASELAKVDKIHLRYFVERIDELANVAEDIADRLAIYAIKRAI